jgi:hypothetical protein
MFNNESAAPGTAKMFKNNDDDDIDQSLLSACLTINAPFCFIQVLGFLLIFNFSHVGNLIENR